MITSWKANKKINYETQFSINSILKNEVEKIKIKMTKKIT
jgi:hypothetical protein